MHGGFVLLSPTKTVHLTACFEQHPRSTTKQYSAGIEYHIDSRNEEISASEVLLLLVLLFPSLSSVIKQNPRASTAAVED